MPVTPAPRFFMKFETFASFFHAPECAPALSVLYGYAVSLVASIESISSLHPSCAEEHLHYTSEIAVRAARLHNALTWFSTNGAEIPKQISFRYVIVLMFSDINNRDVVVGASSMILTMARFYYLSGGSQDEIYADALARYGKQPVPGSAE